MNQHSRNPISFLISLLENSPLKLKEHLKVIGKISEDIRLVGQTYLHTYIMKESYFSFKRNKMTSCLDVFTHIFLHTCSDPVGKILALY